MDRYKTTEQVERAFVEDKEFDFLYADGDGQHFMNPATYDQITVPADIIGDQAQWLQEGMKVLLSVFNEKPVAIQLPPRVALEIVEADLREGADGVFVLQAGEAVDRGPHHGAAAHRDRHARRDPDRGRQLRRARQGLTPQNPGVPAPCRKRRSARGALLGALVGDAAGATLGAAAAGRLRRSGRNRALGHGRRQRCQVAPSQITDDESNLRFALARSACGRGGCRSGQGRKRLCWDPFARSHPFDVGNATRAAFGSFQRQGTGSPRKWSNRPRRRQNMDSKANRTRLVPTRSASESRHRGWRRTRNEAARAEVRGFRIRSSPASLSANAGCCRRDPRLSMNSGGNGDAFDASKATLTTETRAKSKYPSSRKPSVDSDPLITDGS